MVAHPRGHLLQLSAWGDLKAAFGWEPVRVALADPSGRLVAGAQLLLKRLPLRVGRLAYIPYGPLVDWDKAGQVSALMAAIDRTARQHRAALLTVEPGADLDPAVLAAAGFCPGAQTVQPPRSVVLDLTGDEDAILARMNQGTRRNIRKSIKYDIAIRQGTRADVASFNALMAVTGSRDAFGVHAPEYYARAYDLFVPAGRAALFLGSFAGQDLAGVMVFVLGRRAWYLYGASSDQERQRMASYGVQWAAIQWAKQQGAQRYDMVGVPDEDQTALESQFETRSDGLWGVYRFKRGWGGEIVRSVGAWDRPYNRVLYTAYRIAGRFRKL